MTQVRIATHTERLFQLLLLAASIWAVVYTRFALGPLQEAMRVDLSLSDNQVAWLQGPAVAVPMALGAIPLAWLSDRYPRTRVFVFFAVVNLLATALTAVASNLALLFFFRFMVGSAMAAIFVSAYSAVGDLYDPTHRGRATMVVTIGEISGAPAAFALGGALLATVGTDVANWRRALLWMCIPLLLIVVLMLALRNPPRGGAVVERRSLREARFELWHCRNVIAPLLLARVMVWMADGAVLVWGAPVFSRSFGLPPERIGAILATALLASGILGPVVGGALADCCQRSGGPRRTASGLAILALLSVPVGLFSIAPSATLAGVGLALFLTLGFTIATVAMALTTIITPIQLRELFVAIQFTAGAAFGMGVAPLAVSSLSGTMGGPHMISQALAVICAITSALGAVVFGLGRRQFPSRRSA